MDRLRQNWLMSRCDEHNAKTEQQCTLDDGPEDFKDYNHGNKNHAHDIIGHMGEQNWRTDSSNEVGKERITAKGITLNYAFLFDISNDSIYFWRLCKTTFHRIFISYRHHLR